MGGDGAYPGFLGGVVFSTVLAIAARRRRLDELSLSRVAIWGAAAGLLVGVLPFTIGEPTTERPLWLLAAVVMGTITLLSAVSAAGSLALARRAEKRALPGAGVDVADRKQIDRQGHETVAGVEARTVAPVRSRS